MDKSIFIGMPCYGGIQPSCFHAIVALLAALRAKGISAFVGTRADPILHEGRNRLAQAYVASSYTHLLMVDSDVGFKPETVFAMLDRDVDFAAGAVPMRSYDWPKIERAVALGRDHPERFGTRFAVVLEEEPLAGASWWPVARVGGAFMLLTRRVFEKVAEGTPHLAWTDKQGKQKHNYFDTEIVNGEPWSEDFAFCNRWRKAGGVIWLYADATFTHEGPRIFDGNLGELVRETRETAKREGAR